MDFTAASGALQNLEAEVLGVNRDPPASHRRFAEKHSLSAKLQSDADQRVMEDYGLWAKRKMYGREGYGVVRSPPG